MTIETIYELYLQHPSVQTDTRKLKPGDLFFALKGENFNGNRFAPQAIEAGAAYAIIDDPAYEISGKTILVNDTLIALQQLALRHRQQLNILPDGRPLPLLAITGSNGKTTTKELIHTVLSSTYKTYTTAGNLNNHIGIPLTLLKIKKDVEMAVVEMGANHIGEIASYCQYSLPTHGLITNCGKAHLEGFGSIEGVKKAKGELYDFLRQHNGTAYVNWDYEYLQVMSKGIGTIIKYGTTESSAMGRANATVPFLSVEISAPTHFTINTKLIGDYNLSNVLAAVAIGQYFKVPDEKIKQALENYLPSNSRSQLIEKGSNKIILDAYNANPSSMKLAIENFAKLDTDNKIIIIGAMVELGAESIAEHSLLIQQLQQYTWKKVVLVGGDFLQINHPYIQFNDAGEVSKWLSDMNYQDSYFLLKGSRSIAMEQALDF